MIIVLLGASGSGKSTIEQELATHHCFNKIISYTTRNKRDGEENGREYYFTDNNNFASMINTGLMAEYDEYSQGILYGSLISDYSGNDDRVVVLTPNGLRQLKQTCKNEKIISVLVESDLGTRIKRYIDRCGVHQFNFNDKNDITSRVERDYGIFLGLDKEVSLVVHNDEGTNIDDVVNEILYAAQAYNI